MIPSASEVTPNNLANAMSGGMEAAGVSGGKGLLQGIGKTVLKGVGVVSAALSAAAVKAGKDAVAAFADFEQLKGGTELLYGDASAQVMENASNAYKTMQMSANDYLSQVNGFSTGLKTALKGDSAAAAELANRIVQAEADVVAATGVEAESVQNAFNGIMKGNYTMLDNLQLGITPTKQGFQEMIKSVNAYNKAQGNATNYQINNLADCEAALVDYIAMQGLAGYAAMEGSDTLQGALATTKAAWQNLLVGFNSGADVGELVGALIDSATALAQQAMPVITGAITGLFQASGPLLNGAAGLVAELGAVLLANAPALVNAAVAAMSTLGDAFFGALPQLGSVGKEIIIALVGALGMAAPMLAEGAMELIPQLVSGIAAMLPLLAAAAVDIVAGLINGLIAGWPQLKEQGLQAIVQLGLGIWEGLQTLWEPVGEIITTVKSALSEKGNLKSEGENLVQGFIDGIKAKAELAVRSIKDLADRIKRAFTISLKIASPSKVFIAYGGYITEGLVQGISKGRESVGRSVTSLANTSVLSMNTALGAPATGAGGSTVNIYPKSLSKSEIDYILRKSDEKLGARV